MTVRMTTSCCCGATDSDARSSSDHVQQADLMMFDELLETLSADDWLTVSSQLLIVGSAVLFAALFYLATRRLRAVYAQEGRRFSRCRLTGREAVGRLLEHLGLPSDQIEDGAAIDHYDNVRRRVKLRTESSVSSSVAALAIAAHEVGHAEQFATGYWAARGMNGLRVLLIISAVVLLVYPFSAIIAGSGDVNLTRLIALIAIVPILRLPITAVLEHDATKRAKRLLNETGLAHATEQEGIAKLLRAAFFTHLALGTGLILLIGACAATMWLVESALDTPAMSITQVAVLNETQPSGPPPIEVIHFGELDLLPLTALAIAVATVWWAFSGGKRKVPPRCAADANNEGMARFQAGDLAGAIALIDEALRQDPGLASAHYNRAVVLSFQGRRPEALASIDAMFACRPAEVEPLIGIADSWYLRGTLRLDQGDYQGAIDDLSQAFNLEPSEPATLLCNRGLAWLRLGQLDRALQDTNDALALAPADAVAYNNRGVIHRELGDLEHSESDLRRAIEIDPQLPNPREHLAKLLEAQSTTAIGQLSD
jgi:Zn-dependent membrane protease YugP/Flp pilus assembly protein TadD